MLLFCTRGVRLTYDYDDGFPAVVEEALEGFFAKKAVKLISDVGVSISIQSIDSLSLSSLHLYYTIFILILILIFILILILMLPLTLLIISLHRFRSLLLPHFILSIFTFCVD